MTPRAVRIDTTWPVRTQRDGQPASWGNAVNISTTGILFACADRFEVDEIITIYMLVDRYRELRCRARIVRVAGTARRPTFGAEFLRFEGDGHRLLGEALTAAYRASLGEEWQRSAPVGTEAVRRPALSRR